MWLSRQTFGKTGSLLESRKNGHGMLNPQAADGPRRSFRLTRRIRKRHHEQRKRTKTYPKKETADWQAVCGAPARRKGRRERRRGDRRAAKRTREEAKKKKSREEAPREWKKRKFEKKTARNTRLRMTQYPGGDIQDERE